MKKIFCCLILNVMVAVAYAGFGSGGRISETAPSRIGTAESDLNMDTYNIDNVTQIQFADGSVLGSSTTPIGYTIVATYDDLS